MIFTREYHGFALVEDGLIVFRHDEVPLKTSVPSAILIIIEDMIRYGRIENPDDLMAFSVSKCYRLFGFRISPRFDVFSWFFHEGDGLNDLLWGA